MCANDCGGCLHGQNCRHKSEDVYDDRLSSLIVGADMFAVICSAQCLVRCDPRQGLSLRGCTECMRVPMCACPHGCTECMRTRLKPGCVMRARVHGGALARKSGSATVQCICYPCVLLGGYHLDTKGDVEYVAEHL
jgi:hypothetical protein